MCHLGNAKQVALLRTTFILYTLSLTRYNALAMPYADKGTFPAKETNFPPKVSKSVRNGKRPTIVYPSYSAHLTIVELSEML